METKLFLNAFSIKKKEVGKSAGGEIYPITIKPCIECVEH